MKLRDAELPEKVLYVLDGALENRHLTGGAHMACRLYGDIERLTDIVGRERPGNGWAGKTAPMCRELEAYGQSIIRQTDGDVRSALEEASSLSFVRMLADYADFVRGHVFDDGVWGGSFVQRHRTRINSKGRVDRKLNRRLHAPGFVRRAIRLEAREDGYAHLAAIWGIMGCRLHPVSENGAQLLNTILDEQRERSRLRLDEYWRRLDEERRGPKPKPYEIRRATRARRRSTIRATVVASAIMGAATVSAFAKGQSVELPAGEITLRVSLGRSILASGHGGLRVDLVSPRNEFLSGLCVYQDLPVLDQLASLALHVQAGDVGDVIAAGNLYNVSKEAYQNPVIAEKKTRKVVPAQVGAVEAMLRYFDTLDEQRSIQDRYSDEMGRAYVERLFIAILGRQHREGLALLDTVSVG